MQPQTYPAQLGSEPQMQTDSANPKQFSENEAAKVVLVSEPDCATAFAALHPAGALYSHPFNQEQAIKDHTALRAMLSQMGCKVLTIRQILSSQSRETLERAATKSLQYQADPSCGSRGFPESLRQFVSDKYKKEVIESLSVPQLVDVMFLKPIVYLRPSPTNTEVIMTSVSVHPLANMMFTRDQQIVTNKGMVLASMSQPQREEETELMKLVWENLGITSIGRITPPDTLEGADFLTCGNISLCGVGLRTTEGAALQLMKQDLLGSQFFAVVRDCFDRTQQRSHLSKVVGPVGEGLALVDGAVVHGGKQERLVDLYECQDVSTNGPGDIGCYHLIRSQQPLSQFLLSLGWKCLELDSRSQIKNGINVLNLGASRVITADSETAQLLNSWPEFRILGGQALALPFGGIQCMYGSVQSATHIIERDDSLPRGPINKVEVPVPMTHMPLVENCLLEIPTDIPDSVLAPFVGSSTPHSTTASLSRALLEESYNLYRALSMSEVRPRIIMARPGSGPLRIGKGTLFTGTRLIRPEGANGLEFADLIARRRRIPITTMPTGPSSHYFVQKDCIVSDCDTDAGVLAELVRQTGLKRCPSTWCSGDWISVGSTVICSDTPPPFPHDRLVTVNMPLLRSVLGLSLRDVILPLA